MGDVTVFDADHFFSLLFAALSLSSQSGHILSAESTLAVITVKASQNILNVIKTDLPYEKDMQLTRHTKERGVIVV